MKTDVDEFLKSFQGVQVADIGEGMKLVREMICDRWRNRYLVNMETKEVYELVGQDLTLKCVSRDDVDWESLLNYKHRIQAELLSAIYSFTVYAYNDGIAYVNWTLSPELEEGEEGGLYTLDRGEEELGAYIDKQGKILVKFQPIENERMRQRLRNQALQL